MKTRTLLLLLILSLSAAQADIITNGLVGYWNADGNANDSSPTANSGTFPGRYANGVCGQAFDLSTGVVDIPDNGAYALGSTFTLGFWFNTNGMPSSNVAFMSQDNGSGWVPKWIIEYGNSCPNCMEMHLNGTGLTYVRSDALTLPSGWNQFTLVRNGNDYSFYLNGANIGNPTSSTTFPNPSAHLLFGQAEPAFNNFRGLMDDVVMYNRALSATEVYELASTPEPSAIWLAGLAFAALAAIRRKIS